LALPAAWVWLAAAGAMADAVEDARGDLRTGRYEEALKAAEREISDPDAGEAWHAIRVDGLLALGRYPEARMAVTNALVRHRRSIRLLWQAREVFTQNGDARGARQTLDQIGFYVNLRPDLYQDTPDRIIVGRTALAQGADPKLVFDRVYKPAREADPELRDVYLAGGELALDKHDFALAAQWFRDGLRVLPAEPDLLWGLARAYAPSEQALMMESAAAALEVNPRHAGCLLLMADHQITAENDAGADELLDQVLAVNPWHPDAWAYRAVLAHLRNQPTEEEAARANALRYWPDNPRVDHLLGLKLSQKYRFAEGADAQYRALTFDPTYLPARTQLAQDLLRLGWEEEGWEVAAAVQQADEYDVTANNLMTLRDVIGGYTTLTNENFVLRMHPHEASLYGSRALALLDDAHRDIGDKYAMWPGHPVLVEIFQDQKDFAVRTFGMPHNHGFLGVCFGRVITANSPGSRAGASFNWESMLWHEYTHVVTLQLTRNRMPRWLSEGISVYEERAHNPAWGEQLTPTYREMLLDEDLTPVSALSSSFMTPRSGEHLMFAYYQSSLVVEYLVAEFGRESLIGILKDLGEGAAIDDAIARHAAPMARIDAGFADFARNKALSLAPGLDWSKPDRDYLLADLPERISFRRDIRPDSPIPVRVGPPDAVPDHASSTEPPAEAPASTSTNFWLLAAEAERLLMQEQYADAQPILQRLLDLYPDFIGPQSAYRSLAETHRYLGDTRREREALAALAARDDEALDAYQRLMELAAADGDWESVERNAERYLAVNPLVPLPYRHLAEAARALERPDAEIGARRALLQLDPANPAAVHYALARALYETGDRETARRHVLLALEDAPRFREALELLLRVQDPAPPRPIAGTRPPDAARESDT
jgi:tetratricopeptide (TPR) repeat protein